MLIFSQHNLHKSFFSYLGVTSTDAYVSANSRVIVVRFFPQALGAGKLDCYDDGLLEPDDEFDAFNDQTFGDAACECTSCWYFYDVHSTCVEKN